MALYRVTLTSARNPSQPVYRDEDEARLIAAADRLVDCGEADTDAVYLMGDGSIVVELDVETFDPRLAIERGVIEMHHVWEEAGMRLYGLAAVSAREKVGVPR